MELTPPLGGYDFFTAHRVVGTDVFSRTGVRGSSKCEVGGARCLSGVGPMAACGS